MRLLAGLPVNGKRFAPNKAWCKWAEASGCLPTDEQEGDEDDDGASGEDVCDVAASSFEEGDRAEWDGGGAVFGENVLSFANIRFPVESDIESHLSVFDERQYANKLVETQRIVIWPPVNSPKANVPSVFYYCELVCDGFYQNELVKPSNRPFTDDSVLPTQSHLRSTQKSSICPWYSFYRQGHSCFHSNFTSVIDLSFLFNDTISVRRNLTGDFCPWSYWDGRGIFGILEGLFSEKPQRRRRSTRSTSTENDVGGHEMAFLFNTSDDGNDEEFANLANVEDEKVERDDVYMQIQEKGDLEEMEGVDLATLIKPDEDGLTMEEEIVLNVESENEVGESVDASDFERSMSALDVENVTALDQANFDEDTLSSTSASTYACEPPKDTFLRNYAYITNDCSRAAEMINVTMEPRWYWFFRQTRWPFRLAPRQTVDLIMHEIRIPSWRASAARLLLDITRFCGKNPQMKNLILLDPMALSPLSPLLNVLQHSVEPNAHLKGILWMTGADALSPFYCVPVSIPRQDVNGEVAKHPYPAPLYLRCLTVAAFVSNWFAWFSRIETHSSIGVLRFPPELVSDPVAGCVLRPYTLGCGQSPLLDLWPLWLARRLLLMPFHLPRLCGKKLSRHFFPFTDVDEI